MDRKNKIIVSVVGVFIILLALVGITYAYFLTKIEGNTNEKSIYITTANLRLVYRDGTENIVLTGENIEPGYTSKTKVFTVTNEGNADIDEYQVYLENVINTFSADGKKDVTLTITCTSSIEGNTCNGYAGIYPSTNVKLISNSISVDEVHTYNLVVSYTETNEDQSIDMGKILSGKLQIYVPKDIIAISGTVSNYSSNYYVEFQTIITNEDGTEIISETKTSQIVSDEYIIQGIKPGTYKAFIKYINNEGTVVTVGEGQTIKVSKGDIASVSVVDDVTTIVMTDNTDSVEVNISVSTDSITLSSGDIIETETAILLVDTIIDNIKNGTLEGKTTYTENLSAEGMVDNMTTSTDKILSTAEDDYGTTYYFRGNPIDNYVEFADMCWRIVRIQGDSSVKLILASELSCSESNLTTSSGYATDGESGTVGTILEGHYGYKMISVYKINDYVNSEEENSTSARTQLNNWLNRKITSEEQNKLKNDTWCIGDLTNAYSGGKIVGTVTEMISNVNSFLYIAGNKYSETKTPSYKCETTGVDGETDTNKIGMLTFDEIIYAGGGSASNSNYYLNNNVTTNYWWTLSPEFFDVVGSDDVFFVGSDGSVNVGFVEYSDGFYRPAVSLATGTEIVEGGEGTISNPYVVK